MATPRKESDVYDRQIRLWGAEAQQKISQARVLYLHTTGVSSEILKNLVLAGVSATLCDGRSYPDSVRDVPSFFWKQEPAETATSAPSNNNNNKKRKYTNASVAHVMKPHVEELNPLLGECTIYDTPLEDLTEHFLARFDMVVATRMDVKQAVRISKLTVAHGGKFFMVDCFGLEGACIIDLGGTHTYRREKGKALGDLESLDTYLSFDDILNVHLMDVTSRVDKTAPPTVWTHYRSILEYQRQTGKWPSHQERDDFVKVIQHWIATEAPELKDHPTVSKDALTHLATTATAEVSPVCAVLGGVIGNELIKAISGKGEPANNTLLFDGFEGKCRNVLVKPKESK